MATNLPNIPFRSPIADESGMISQAWSNWFRDLFKRTGSSQALSNTELADELSSGAIAAEIAAIQVSVALLQVASAGGDNLTQGRAL